ncbi:MAG: hypothetical protein WBC19_10690 [Pyrinomonadaceae bacterium]
MKRCPQCNQPYDDLTDFCVNDGTPLQALSSFVSADVPTQVFTPNVAKMASARETSKSIYIAVGVMATVIIGLLAALFYISSEKKGTENKTTQITAKPESTQPPPSNTLSGNAPGTPDRLPITENAARELIVRWKNAQNVKSFSAYRSCYTPTTEFIGIKRTPGGGREQMSFNSWMNDRGKMIRNIIDVQADIRSISIDGETAVAVFTQKWRSVRLCDIGEKTLRIKMFADGPKIVFEELKDPILCS